MNALLPFLSLFAGPIGNLITTALSNGATAFIVYAVAKGMDVSTATQVAAAGVGAIAALINWGAGMLGVKVNVVNDPSSGNMTVVKATDAAQKGVPTLDPTSAR